MAAARAVPCLVVLTLLAVAPLAAAEWGRYGEDGWPVAVDGSSTRPEGAAAGPLNVVGDATLYPYWPLLTAEVQRLSQEHPDFVKVHSLGKSTLGLDLWMLEIADFGNASMKPLEERERLWVDGGTHSNEYSGVYFAARLASFLLDEYETNETAKWIVENRHTWIMPMVNPDGSHAFGRLNAHGVNINRNYPVGWAGLEEDPIMNNPGPSAASEVETQANLEWFEKIRPDFYVSIHCCGNLWLYPYGIEGIDPPDRQVFDRVCDEAFPTVRDDCGPIWSTIYPASGSSVDSVYEVAGTIAFGYEMSGRGAISLWGQPFTTARVEEQEIESWNGVLHAFLNVEKYGARLEKVGYAVGDDTISVLLRNVGYGNLTAGNASIGERTAPISFLAPGEEAWVTLSGPFPAGEVPLRLEYPKRVMAAPLQVDAARLLITLDAAGKVVEVQLSEGEPLRANGVDLDGSRIPVAPLLALGALAAAGLLRRRA